ncbi:MAG: S46 family peptidase [Bacteroidota bacterium]
MRIVCASLLALIVLLPHTAYGQDADKAGRFDNGKMWTFDHPPFEYFEEAYNFTPSQSWFDTARLGALRIPGCSASFVSGYGLVLTNHHCARNAVTQVSNPGERLTEDGFYATTLEEERQVPGYYADQLVAIEDVTQAVREAEMRGETDAERAQARQDTIDAVTAMLLDGLGGEEAGYVIEIIPFYHGGKYAAYTFKRYDDVRLVFTPELQMGYYGGDADNFTFPRYALDMTFFRVYDDNVPFEPEHYFLWSMDGAQIGEPVFVIGNPGSTSRLETVAQLEGRRDMTDKNLLAFIKSHIQALRDYQDAATTDDAKNAVRNQLFSLLNAEKAYAGQLAALADPVIMARRRDAEGQFVKAISADDDLAADYGSLMEDMAAIQKEMRAYSKEHAAFFALTSGTYSAALLRRAILAHGYLDRMAAGGGEQLAPLKEQLLGIADTPAGLDLQFLKTRLQDMTAAFGTESELVGALLTGQSATDRAQGIVGSSALASQAQLTEALDAGTLDAMDPAIKLVDSFIETYQTYQSAFAGLSAQQSEIASSIGRARYAVYQNEIPPDATFSLRLADGVVQGYPYNGTYASPFTSFFGLYDHYHSYGSESEWDLPERWKAAPKDLDLSVPVNFASTNDIIGGNSGSPIVNKDLELVGLIFDGNIESLSGNYIYLPDRARSVSVDARGMLEALDAVYEADRIVEELANDVLVSDDAAVGGGE